MLQQQSNYESQMTKTKLFLQDEAISLMFIGKKETRERDKYWRVK